MASGDNKNKVQYQGQVSIIWVVIQAQNGKMVWFDVATVALRVIWATVRAQNTVIDLGDTINATHINDRTGTQWYVRSWINISTQDSRTIVSRNRSYNQCKSHLSDSVCILWCVDPFSARVFYYFCDISSRKSTIARASTNTVGLHFRLYPQQ